MKGKQSIVVTLALVVLIIALGTMIVMPSFKRAKAWSGPSMAGNLRSIEHNKLSWQTEETNEWPTASNLLLSPWGQPLNEFMRRRYGELYIINRTGEPPVAYIPKNSGEYRAGEFWYLSSNGFERYQGRLSPEAWRVSGITNIPKLR
jgi:hypothetical protein